MKTNSFTTWNPFGDLRLLSSRIGDLVDQGLTQAGGEENVTNADWRPVVDIVERKTEYLIIAELPGVEKGDVKVTVDKGLLTIKGERRYEKEADEDKVHRVERFFGTFSRSFRFPEDADPEKVNAEFSNGVLRVQLNKLEVAQPKSVEVVVA